MKTDQQTSEFIIKNSLDGGFLQSFQWLSFQGIVGKKVFHVQSEEFEAGMLEHSLPIVGKYFYCPRGPVMGNLSKENLKENLSGILNLARENNEGWIRIEPSSESNLKKIKENIRERLVQAPHDMQPREIFMIDISKPAEQLLAEMKTKTRYNIGIAKKKNVRILASKKMNTSKIFFV